MGIALKLLLANLDMLSAGLPDSKFVVALAVIALGGAAYGVAALITGAVRLSDLKR